MSVDKRLLIKQIEARPALWNRDDKDYCHKQIVSKQWAEIALIHGVHESRVKSKWKALRDTFRQELKKNPQQSAWNYYLDMQFLKGQIKQPTAANRAAFGEDDSEEVTFVKSEPDDGSSYYGDDHGRSMSKEPEDDPGCASADVSREGDHLQMNPDVDDDDYHFLMSLLPEMRKLDPRRKLLLRIKIMELFYKETYQKEL